MHLIYLQTSLLHWTHSVIRFEKHGEAKKKRRRREETNSTVEQWRVCICETVMVRCHIIANIAVQQKIWLYMKFANFYTVYTCVSRRPFKYTTQCECEYIISAVYQPILQKSKRKQYNRNSMEVKIDYL